MTDTKHGTTYIQMDGPTTLFYKGIGAAKKVTDALSASFPTPIDEKTVAGWWFYVGLIAGQEHGLVEEDDIIVFLQGATTQAPSIAASKARMLSDTTQAAVEKVIALVVADYPTAQTVRLQCRSLGGSVYGYDPRTLRVTPPADEWALPHLELSEQICRDLAADADEPPECYDWLTINVLTAEIV